MWGPDLFLIPTNNFATTVVKLLQTQILYVSGMVLSSAGGFVTVRGKHYADAYAMQ